MTHQATVGVAARRIIRAMAAAPLTINPRSIQNEGRIVLVDGLTAAQLGELSDLLHEAGHPPSLVYGLLGWLAAKAAGRPDRTSAPTRARYRRILAEFDPATLNRVIPG